VTLGGWLRELREAAALTPAQAAVAAGTEERAIYRWERDEVEPRARALLRLFRAYGVRTDPAVPKGVV
jgi:transcriptional regulator with XRE-family HTH domain